MYIQNWHKNEGLSWYVYHFVRNSNLNKILMKVRKVQIQFCVHSKRILFYSIYWDFICYDVFYVKKKRAKGVKILRFWCLVQIWSASKWDSRNLWSEFWQLTNKLWIWNFRRSWRTYLDILICTQYIGLAISTEEKKPLTFSMPTNCSPHPTNAK